MEWTETLDAIGLLCPLPVLRARKRLAGMAPGAVLRLTTTDPAAIVDVPHFCAEAGHALLSEADECGVRVWLIRRGA
jgi:tRNA 2-thiouridine synthesizing protein A